MNKPSSEKLRSIVDGFVKESEVDYVGLWEVSKVAREELGARTLQDVRGIGLKIVKGLYERGLRPGHYDYAQHIDFWPDGGCQAMLDRIEREWIELNADPTHINPICSFLRPRS